MMKTDFAAPLRGRRLERVKAFLEANHLRWEDDADATLLITEDEEIVATGSLCGNILKYIAISPEHQGSGLTSSVITPLIRFAIETGHEHLFIFTKPENEYLFTPYGFYPVAKTSSVLLLENRRDAVKAFVQSLVAPVKTGTIGAIVANCNPFTLGHLYLVNEAAQQCDLLHLFILSENVGMFTAAERYEMALQATSHIKNVVLHPTNDYMVSKVTFPAYFLKDSANAADVNTELDLTIFAECFAKPLGVTHRFVGSEPFCPVTRAYNEQMKHILPDRYGVTVVELPRAAAGHGEISASHVRELLTRGDWDSIRSIVPPTTFAFLQTRRAKGG